MRRLTTLLMLLIAALGIHATAFAFLLDRPLDLGPLRQVFAEKRAVATTLPSPKLLIFAGSNALFSHSCAVIGPMLGLPCINGGIAVGLGLDYQFALWKPLLHPGDVVYMPLELEQYTISRPASLVGPDTAILWRHQRTLLPELGPRRTAAALFSGTAQDAIASLVEMTAAGLRPALAHPAFAETDAWGDAIGHDLAAAVPNRAFLASLHRPDPAPGAIASGYGTREVEAFRAWAAAHGVRVIGGWPTEFADAPPDPRLVPLLSHLYGGDFLRLPSEGRYPRRDFFDSQDHLVSECQALHSIRVARGLAPMLGLSARPPAPEAARMAARCP